MAVANALTKYELKCNGVVVGYYDTLEEVKSKMTATVQGQGTWNFTWSKGKIVYNAWRNGVPSGVYDNVPDADADAKGGIPSLTGEAGSYGAKVESMVMADGDQAGGNN